MGRLESGRRRRLASSPLTEHASTVMPRATGSATAQCWTRSWQSVAPLGCLRREARREEAKEASARAAAQASEVARAAVVSEAQTGSGREPEARAPSRSRTRTSTELGHSREVGHLRHRRKAGHRQHICRVKDGHRDKEIRRDSHNSSLSSRRHGVKDGEVESAQSSKGMIQGQRLGCKEYRMARRNRQRSRSRRR